MSKPTVAAEVCLSLGAAGPQLEALAVRETALGELPVARALPLKGRRLVGPWCFLDRFGPLTFSSGRPMDVAPHPHIGLQTVTWLLAGEVAHDDSLSHEAVLRPGGVNVMTSGDGIAHSERTPRDHSGRLNGVQLWTALPEAHRHGPAAFEHVEQVPAVEMAGGIVQVFSGAAAGVVSPAPHFSELVGADLTVHPRHTLTIPLRHDFEHGLLLLGGDCAFESQALDARTFYYLGTRRTEAAFSTSRGARVLLVGGVPFPETILMWWNFVARTPEEIEAARNDWEARRRFGEVVRYGGPRLSAPDLLHLARAEPVS